MSTAPVGAPATQASYAYDRIRRAIVTGELSSGDRLMQAEWANLLGVSVTPVREALRRLEQEGLIESLPHRGTTVKGLTLARAEEIYAMRLLVEPLLMRQTFGQVSEEALAAAEKLADEMQVTRDPIVFNELNEQFHALTMVYDDSWTARVVQMLAGAAAPYVSLSVRLKPEQITDSNANHYAQAQAIRDGDVDRFVELGVEHLESTINILRCMGAEAPESQGPPD